MDEGLAVATSGLDEGLSLGLTQQAAACGDACVEALIWLGRLEGAELQLAALRGFGLADDRERRLTSELLLARGDADAAEPLVRAAAADARALDVHPDDCDVLREVTLAVELDDALLALEAAISYLAQLDELRLTADRQRGCTNWVPRARAHPIDNRTGSRGDTGPAELQLERARVGLTDEWRTTYHGVQLALAEAYAARVAGEPAIEQFRAAVDLAKPFGAFFALEPRLDLAQELLAHGGRDEGRELLVDCWTAAHEMGAGGLERRAFRLATRARVPLPESASSEGPFSRLTPREREILEQLATGATNKSIAAELVISEKTVSVHVSNVLAKLEVDNRGAAAALARTLLG